MNGSETNAINDFVSLQGTFAKAEPYTFNDLQSSYMANKNNIRDKKQREDSIQRNYIMNNSVKAFSISAGTTDHSKTGLACNQCDKSFATTQKLRYQIKGIHQKIKDFSCAHRSYATAFKHDLTKLIRKIHDRK